MAFTFKLQTRDGMPADPPTLLTVAPSWRPGDTIPVLGSRSEPGKNAADLSVR